MTTLSRSKRERLVNYILDRMEVEEFGMLNLGFSNGKPCQLDWRLFRSEKRVVETPTMALDRLDDPDAGTPIESPLPSPPRRLRHLPPKPDATQIELPAPSARVLKPETQPRVLFAGRVPDGSDAKRVERRPIPAHIPDPELAREREAHLARRAARGEATGAPVRPWTRREMVLAENLEGWAVHETREGDVRVDHV